VFARNFRIKLEPLAHFPQWSYQSSGSRPFPVKLSIISCCHSTMKIPTMWVFISAGLLKS